MDYQLLYKTIVIFLYASLTTYWITPIVMKKLTRHDAIRPDKYKRGKNATFVTMGGLAMLVGVLISLSLSQILLPIEDLGRLFIFYFIVVVYALYGFSDDLFGSSEGVSVLSARYDKVIAVLLLSFPIASLITDTNIQLFSNTFELGALFALILAPVYIMVVANLINLHSGYNGLATGTSWLILVAILIESLQRVGLTDAIFIVPMLGALTGFIPFNLYPAKAHDANVGAFMVGGAIGIALLALNLEMFGIFILIPHIINFIMDTWTIIIRKKKDVRFGRLRHDGTIEAPPTMKYKSLKFLVVSWFRLTEKQATMILWAFTAIFCILGVIIF